MAARVPSCCVLHPVELCVGHRAICRVSEPHKLHSVPILTVAAPPFLVPGLNSRCGVRCHPRSRSPHRHGPEPSLHHHPNVMTADNTCPNGTIPLTPVAEHRARAPLGSTVYLTVGLAVTLDVPGACRITPSLCQATPSNVIPSNRACSRLLAASAHPCHSECTAQVTYVPS
jgi:hypothetical protein